MKAIMGFWGITQIVFLRKHPIFIFEESLIMVFLRKSLWNFWEIAQIAFLWKTHPIMYFWGNDHNGIFVETSILAFLKKPLLRTCPFPAPANWSTKISTFFGWSVQHPPSERRLCVMCRSNDGRYKKNTSLLPFLAFAYINYLVY